MKKSNKKFILVFAAFLFFLTFSFCISLYLRFGTKNNNYKCPNCNVIYISIDALRADHLGCYGYNRNTSSNIDKLSSGGILFSQAISQAPYTALSVPSIMTSLYPSMLNIEKISNLQNILYKGVSTMTLTEALSGTGYSTAGFGYGMAGKLFAVNQGFRDFRYINTVLDNSELEKQIIPWLEANHQKKFFLFLHTYSVHDPYILPSPYDKMYDPDYDGKMKFSTEDLPSKLRGQPDIDEIRKFLQQNLGNVHNERDLLHLIALYDGRITYTDEFIGRLLDKIRALNLFKNTVIILTADHGEEFFEHGHFRHGEGGLYDQVLHIPLIIKIPNIEPKIIKQQVRAIDLMPTVLDILDIDNSAANEQMQGASLIPAIYGKNLNLFAFSELYFSLGNSKKIASIRNEEWKYIVTTAEKSIEEELYDLNKDPEEQNNLTNNLTNDFTKTLERLKRKMAEWQKTNKELSQKYAFSREESLTKDEMTELINMLENLGHIEPTEIQKPDL